MDNEQSYSREAVVAELEFQATEQMRPMFRSFKTECFQILINHDGFQTESHSEKYRQHSCAG